MTIKVNSENRNKKRRTDLSWAGKIAAAVLRELNKDNAELNVVFLSNQQIRVFNRVYLARDRATDVIAFAGDGADFKVKSEIEKSREFLGDIAVSTDKAAQNAEIYGVTVAEEVALYVIHGILHLTGYGDNTKKLRDRMRKKEDELLQKIKKIV